jgi:hypothetical protein
MLPLAAIVITPLWRKFSEALLLSLLDRTRQEPARIHACQRAAIARSYMKAFSCWLRHYMKSIELHTGYYATPLAPRIAIRSSADMIADTIIATEGPLLIISQ